MRTAAMVALVACLSAAPASAQDLTIVNARIIDGTGRVIERGTIVIDDGRIASVVEGSVTGGAADIDARGMTVMPGLIDTHRHDLLGDLQGMAALLDNADVATAIENRTPANLQSLLDQGFTTVMMPGTYLSASRRVRQLLDDGTIQGPRLLFSGPAFTAPGDFPATGMVCQGNAYCMEQVAFQVTDPALARSHVRTLAEAGVDAIKLIVDDVGADLDDTVFAAIIDEAESLGLQTMLHAHRVEDMLDGVRLGVDRLVHTPGDAPIADGDGARILRERGVAIATTVSLSSPQFADAMGFESTGDTHRQVLENIRHLVDEGVVVAFGTDSPDRITAQVELEQLSTVLRPDEIIRAMTRDAAIFLNLDDEIGTLEPGKIADLVIIDGDPLDDISNLANVAAVIRGGVVVAQNAASAQTAPAAQPDAIDAWMEEYLGREQVPGVALAIMKGGRIVKARGYGFANIEHDVPVTAETVFQSGSVGKQFTSAAILLLVGDGKLLLDDTVTEYVKNAPAAWSDITIRHLLSHTSGLADYTDIDLWRDYTEAELLETFASLPRHFAPGDEWSYSNTGYVLLGMVIRAVTGAHWGELVEARIFEPLGMTTARVISEADIVPNRAAGYRLVDGVIRNQEWVAPSLNTTADGALYLSVLDFAKWDAALYDHALLSDESRRLMWTPTRLNDGTTTGYGFGWRIYEEPLVVEHGGSWQGFRSFIARFTTDSITVVALANAAHADAGAVAHNIAGLYQPSLRADPTFVPIAAVQLKAYEGRYRFPDGTTFDVTAVADGLRVSGMGEEGMMRFTGEDGFYEPDWVMPVSFSRDDAGAVVFVHVGAMRGRKVATGDTQDGSAFAIEDVRVFDGLRVIPSATVVVEDGRVVALGADVSVPADAARIDGSGRTLLPGLIDAHVHTIGELSALRDATRFGVTTVLEMLSGPDRMQALRAEADTEACSAADYFTSGAGATVSGGHGHFSDAYPTLATPQEADAFVRARIAEGSQYIKIFIERGFPGRPTPTLDSATVRALIVAAHRHDRLAVVHATRAPDARFAIEAGADGLAHLWQGGIDAELLELARTRGVFVIPTLTMIESMIDSAGSASVTGDALLAPYIAEHALETLVPARAGRLRGTREDFFAIVRQLNDAGVPILAGTDAPNPGLAHGVSLHRELELLVHAGLTPLEALRAATSAPATAFALEGHGRIAAGGRADLVLVEGDPTSDIRSTRSIVAIWKCGERIERELPQSAR